MMAALASLATKPDKPTPMPRSDQKPTLWIGGRNEAAGIKLIGGIVVESREGVLKLNRLLE
jgi:hypothetical protein